MTNRPPNCKAYERGDQWFCDRCGLIWDLNDDDPPECAPVRVNVGTPSHIDHGSPSRDKEFAHNQVEKMRNILNKEPEK